ncbi:hypothetical protein ACQP1W_49545 [Spirillospora sp. CA-255316]
MITSAMESGCGRRRTGMRQRIRDVGGALEIESALGEGIAVRVRVHAITVGPP